MQPNSEIPLSNIELGKLYKITRINKPNDETCVEIGDIIIWNGHNFINFNFDMQVPDIKSSGTVFAKPLEKGEQVVLENE